MSSYVLYFAYRTLNYGQQYAKYDGNTITLITNMSDWENTRMVLYNNKLYFDFIDGLSKSHLAEYDGTKITLIPAPVSGFYILKSDYIIFKNRLYFKCKTSVGNYFAYYDGASITITNAKCGDANMSNMIIYNDLIYFQYHYEYNADVAQYDGDSTVSLLTDGYKDYLKNPFIFHDTLFFEYCYRSDCLTEPELAKFYDGKITGVSIFKDNTYIHSYNRIIYHDTLFYHCHTSFGSDYLAKYNGEKLTVIPNPDASPDGVTGCFIIFNDSLFFPYEVRDGVRKLAKLNTTYNSFKIHKSNNNIIVFPNPTSGLINIYGDEYFKIEVLNYTGNFEGFHYGNQINLSSLPPGLYFLNIYGYRGLIKSEKIILMK